MAKAVADTNGAELQGGFASDNSDRKSCYALALADARKVFRSASNRRR
jgi:hypothetical protein